MIIVTMQLIVSVDIVIITASYAIGMEATVASPLAYQNMEIFVAVRVIIAWILKQSKEKKLFYVDPLLWRLILCLRF